MKKRDLIGTLQMQLKATQHKIDGYESGKRYQMIEESHRKSRRHYQRIIEQKNARIRELEHTLEKFYLRTVLPSELLRIYQFIKDCLQGYIHMPGKSEIMIFLKVNGY